MELLLQLEHGLVAAFRLRHSKIYFASLSGVSLLLYIYLVFIFIRLNLKLRVIIFLHGGV